MTTDELPTALDDKALATIYQRGRLAYPDLNLSRHAFLTHLSRVAALRPGQRPTEIVDHVEDLYLAFACLEEVPGANEQFQARYQVAIRSAVERISSSSATQDDAEQEVYRRVLVASPDAAPRLASYVGLGPLQAWLMVAAQRVTLTLLRSEGAERRARTNAVEVTVDSIMSPEVRLLKLRYGAIVQAALSQAMSALSERDRVLLSLRFVSGATVESIGRAYGVSQPTASRMLQQIRARIVDETKRLLRAQFPMESDEFESLTTLMLSGLDISVSLLLGRSASS
jgi:RNA polymerase sigma-70 factor (ECF subfamily)